MTYSDTTSTQTPQVATLTPSHQKRTYMTGTFEMFTLFDLLLTITQGAKSCRLVLPIAGQHAEIITHLGHIVAASYNGKIGERALHTIFLAVEEQNDIEYLVEPLEAFSAETQSIYFKLEEVLKGVTEKLETYREMKAMDALLLQ